MGWTQTLKHAYGMVVGVMGKTFETKRKILALLEQRSNTLTGISDFLGLTPPTVKQHLTELLDSGDITVIDTPYFKRLKYYSRTRPKMAIQGIT